MIVIHIDLTWWGLTSQDVYMTLLLYTIINITIVLMIIIYHTTPLQFLNRRSQQFSENQNIKIIKPYVLRSFYVSMVCFVYIAFFMFL